MPESLVTIPESSNPRPRNRPVTIAGISGHDHRNTHHTDNRPINGFMGKGNWGLSTFRAISLWQFWERVLPADMKLSRLVNADGLPLFSVSGYAETRPALREQLTEVDFRRNRRIDIRFTIRRPDSSAYEQVRDRLEEAAS